MLEPLTQEMFMAATAPAPQLPFARPNALDLAPLFARLRQQGPLARVTTPAGDPAWLVTTYDEARAILGDPRFGKSHPAPETASRISSAAIQSGPISTFEDEAREHARMRRMLVPAFTAPRMRRLSARIEHLAGRCLDGMDEARRSRPDAPLNLHDHLSFPLPVQVICELLGVPSGDRDLLRGWSERIGALHGGADGQAAMAEFQAYIATLAEKKRLSPGEDVITDILKVQAEDATFTEDDMTRLAAGLLFAGHETTSTRIDFGVMFLLSDPARRDCFAVDPAAQVQDTVEEILRMAAPGGLGLMRYAREDVTIGKDVIARGDAVLVAINSANRDAKRFEAPDTFNPSRTPNAHLAFGHGGHYCLGNALARTEMRIAFTALFRRMPRLHLAVDPHTLPDHTERLAGGVSNVPVLW
ncbi:cytochrome P450 [Streptomyces sp. NPDC001312]|uniref:cytochrome P450 n=1 Tax=Streptomyces sp. NPDC001312 TaxID=3364561 RepID=UPI0036D11C0F